MYFLVYYHGRKNCLQYIRVHGLSLSIKRAKSIPGQSRQVHPPPLITCMKPSLGSDSVAKLYIYSTFMLNIVQVELL